MLLQDMSFILTRKKKKKKKKESIQASSTTECDVIISPQILKLAMKWEKWYSSPYIYIYIFENFNLWRLFLMMAHCHQTKIPIDFRCRQKLNPRFLIQLSETLPVNLIRIYFFLRNTIKRSAEQK